MVYNHLPLLLLLKEQPQLAALKVTISLEDQEKKKDRKTQKGKSEEKVASFSSGSLFPARKQEAVTQGGTRGVRPSDAEENPRSLYRQKL